MIEASRLQAAARHAVATDSSMAASFDAAVQDNVRLSEAAPAPRRSMILSESGAPKPLLANALIALGDSPEWAGVLARNEFSLGTHALKPTPWGFTGKWNETQDAKTAEYLQHRRILVSVDTAACAVETVADENSFHPVRNFLDGLRWDGIPRLDRWLHKYAGTDDGAYTRAVGAKWCISAVARIRRPGCKADHVPILEGEQGAGKSSLCRILGGEFFSDEIADLGSKDSAMQVSGTWILELPEIDALARSEQSKLKAFISRSTDRFRPPYGRRVIEAPRQSVFIGTVNNSSYLKDESGGRRYWPVRCGCIDLVALRRDREQLWAEAAYRYEAGEAWWLDSQALTIKAQDEQSQRYEGDPWEPLIETWTEGREYVTVEQILLVCVEKPKAQWTQADKNRVGRCLRTLGWDKFQQRTGESREWRFRRAAK